MYSHNLNYIYCYEKGNKRTIIFIILAITHLYSNFCFMFPYKFFFQSQNFIHLVIKIKVINWSHATQSAIVTSSTKSVMHCKQNNLFYFLFRCYRNSRLLQVIK